MALLNHFITVCAYGGEKHNHKKMCDDTAVPPGGWALNYIMFSIKIQTHQAYMHYVVW